MKKILLIIAMVLAALAPVSMFTPAHAETVTCYDENKNIDDYFVAESVGEDFNTRFRLHIDYRHCVGVYTHYDIMDKFVGSVTPLGNKNCTSFRHYHIDPGTIDGYNQPDWSWDCVDGQPSYTHAQTLDWQVGGGSSDRCVAIYWRIDRAFYAGDIDGTSSTGCLG